MMNLRYRIILKHLGVVSWVLAGELALAAMAAVLLGDWRSIACYLLISMALAAGGWALVRNVPEREVTGPEAMAVAALSFFAASVAGALPFIFLGGMPPLDAWFDAMSAYTTTGFSLLDLTRAPRSLLFFRALSQWLGGLGFVLFTVSLFIGSHMVSARGAIAMLKNDRHEESFFPRIATHVKVVVYTYASLTIVGVAVLLSTGVGVFDAVCYTLSGVSTGGFATHPASAAGLGSGSAALWGLIFIMLLGSTNFLIYYRVMQARRTLKGISRAVLEDLQFPALIIIVVAASAAVYLSAGWGGGLTGAFFLSASALSTTGYSAADAGLMPAFPMALVVLLMFVGGSVRSSAGGIKLHRLIQIFRGMHDLMLARVYPVELVRRKALEKDELTDILMVISFYAITVASGTLVFIACGYGPLSSAFEVTSAVSTVGLSAGIVSTGLGAGLKALMILLMWAGRVEFIPIMALSYSMAARVR